MTAPSLSRRAWIGLMATLLPGLAAAIFVGAAAGRAAALGCAVVVLLVSGLLALVAEMEFARQADALATEQDSRGRAAEAERQDALRGVRTLDAVLEGMPEGVWITDGTGVVLRHNEALTSMLGGSQDLVGKRPLFLVRKSELQDAVLAACQSGRATTLEVSMEGVRPRTLEVRVTPLGGDLAGSAAVFRDITELKRLERVRQDFVANVSHELRTPIAAILGYAETLRAGALSDAAHAPQMVEIIHRQSERLSELVTDLLELSRLDAGERPLLQIPVALDEVATRASEAVEPRAMGKRLTLRRTVPPGLTARADPQALEQVLLNLLENAIKYTPEGGAVELTGEQVDGQCLLRVKDTGLGIDAKHLPRLFERFYRVDRGRSRDMGGTGLGLSIVRHLVSGMRGDVRVTSQMGMGSTFTVVLPAA